MKTLITCILLICSNFLYAQTNFPTGIKVGTKALINKNGQIYQGSNTKADSIVATRGALLKESAKKIDKRDTISGDSLLYNTNLTGIPTAPTASNGTNTTQIATTAFVQTSLSNAQSDGLVKIMQQLGSTAKYAVTGLTNPGASSYTMVDGTIYLGKVYISSTTTLTGVMFGQTTAGDYTGDNFNGVALYSYSNGTLTRVAVSSTSADLWKVSYWGGSIAFTSTYSASPGMYVIAALYNSSAETTAPQLVAGTSWGNNMASYCFGISYGFYTTLAGQTTMPSSITESSTSATPLPVLLMLY